MLENTVLQNYDYAISCKGRKGYIAEYVQKSMPNFMSSLG